MIQGSQFRVSALNQALPPAVLHPDKKREPLELSCNITGLIIIENNQFGFLENQKQHENIDIREHNS